MCPSLGEDIFFKVILQNPALSHLLFYSLRDEAFLLSIETRKGRQIGYIIPFKKNADIQSQDKKGNPPYSHSLIARGPELNTNETVEKLPKPAFTFSFTLVGFGYLLK